MEEKQAWKKLESRKIALDIPGDDQKLAETIKDSLGIMGWCPWWEQERTEGSYHFKISNFGAEYKIILHDSTGNLEVSRRAKGIGHVFHSLHFLGGSIPNGTRIVNSWHYYQNLNVFFILIAAITGTLLFLKRKSERVVGISIAIGSFGLSVLLMLYIWLVG